MGRFLDGILGSRIELSMDERGAEYSTPLYMFLPRFSKSERRDFRMINKEINLILI